MVAYWLVLLPHNKKVIGLIPGLGSLCVKFACVPCVCVGFLEVLQFPPTVQKQAFEVNWKC